jgi:signal transduction histidine kinase
MTTTAPPQVPVPTVVAEPVGPPPTRPGRSVSWTLTAAFAVLLASLAALGAVGLVTTLVTRSQFQYLVNTVGPSRRANTAALQAMTNAETGVRGYLIGHDPTFLEPYRAGVATLGPSLAVIAADIRGNPTVQAGVAAQRAAAAAWQRGYAEPAIAGRNPSPQAGKRLFDRFRATNASLETAIDDIRVRKTDEFNRTLTVTIGLIGGVMVIALAVGVRTALVTTRRLVRPLRSTTEAVSSLALGRYETRLTPAGPRETQEVGRSVNTLADQLDRAAVERARSAADLEAANDRLRAANDELEAFSYSVSHDLRSPLRAVGGFSHILLEQYAAELPEQARGYLGRVEQGATRMGALIDDLLAFAHVNRQTMRRNQVDPAEIARRALTDLDSERAGRAVEVTIGDLPVCMADAALLTLVFTNLLSNALKFTRDRDPARIEVGSRRQAGEAVYFVADNGAGFDPRHADKLFGVFQRLHRADQFTGTGVGLALVARIIHRHGGRIWADGVPDEGATFSFTLAEATHP